VATTWAAAELSFEPQQRSFEIHPQTLPSTPPGFEADVDEPVRNPFAGGKMIGTIFNTYVAYDLGHELGLMDQHAAHERIRFEKLRKGFLDSTSSQSASQALLVPETVSVPQESFAALENRLPLLSQMGFEVEIFGADCILVRAIPANWGSGDLNTRLRNLVERLLSLDEVAPSSTDLKMDERSFERLASEACHSSVRAGDRLEPVQAQALLDQLFACAHPWNCPHGRPTIVKVPRARFEEWFQRKI
jgi:DNA mismatch repair protein MutL